MDTQSQDAMDFFLFHSPVSWIALSMVKENGTGSCAGPSNNNDPTEECLVKIKTGFLTKQVNVGSPKEGKLATWFFCSTSSPSCIFLNKLTNGGIASKKVMPCRGNTFG